MLLKDGEGRFRARERTFDRTSRCLKISSMVSRAHRVVRRRPALEARADRHRRQDGVRAFVPRRGAPLGSLGYRRHHPKFAGVGSRESVRGSDGMNGYINCSATDSGSLSVTP